MAGTEAPVVNGTTLRQLRLARGWTQAQLAQYLGVHKITVSRWERGERQCRGAARVAILALGKTEETPT